jgi:methyl-accepting chemotaxis protein
MSALGVLAAGSALKLVIDAASDYRTAIRATEAIDVISQVLLVPEKVTFERLQMTKPLDPKTTPSAQDLAKLDAARKDADATIERSIAAIAGSNYAGARDELAEINKVKDSLQALRREADGVMAKPAEQRDPEVYAAFNTKFRVTTEDLFAQIDRIADNVDLVATGIDNELSGFIELARRAWAIRDGGSRRVSIFLGPMQTGKPLTADQLEKLAAADMRMDMNWEAIEATAKHLGNIPALDTAIAAAHDKYYGDADMVYRGVVAAGRKGTEYPYQDNFAQRHLAGVNAPLAIRDTAFAVARSFVSNKKKSAAISLAGAAVALLLILGVGVTVTLVLTRRIVSPLVALTDVIGRLAQGDREVVVPARDRTDEIGMMAGAIETLRQNALEAAQLAERSAAETQARQARAERIEAATGEFDRASGTVIKSFHDATRTMLDQAGSTSTVAQRVEEQTTAVAAAIAQAAANVETVATAAEELSRSITEIGQRIERSAAISTEAQEMANQATREISSLAEASEQIGAVIDMIQNIASQTNLLALNATIEAARAGESGKGFAVVASEVKTLASQTAKATDEIAAQIARIQGETGSAVERIRRLAETIADTTKLATEVAAAVEEQNVATAEIARNVQQAATGNHLVTSKMSEVSAAMAQSREAATRMVETIGQLSQRAEGLTNEISSFLTEIRAA